GRGGGLGYPSSSAFQGRTPVLPGLRRVRRLAGPVDCVVDPAEPVVGLHEPRARVFRLRRGRRTGGRRDAPAIRGGGGDVTRRPVRVGARGEGGARLVL